ncbi:MAG: glycoside hydrolase family 43 protein, partial [Blautia sp.]|nr:glycoside hydrolase family 43 protein [Blautia sp.]
MRHNRSFVAYVILAAGMAALLAGAGICSAAGEIQETEEAGAAGTAEMTEAPGSESEMQPDVETNVDNTTRMISPIIDMEGADPYVMRYGEGYLYTKTTGGDIRLAYADSIAAVGLVQMKTVYDPGTELRDLWAPEIWNLDGVWYIYFAAVAPGEEMHFMYVLSNPAENPLEGEWTLQPVGGMDDKFAIDGTILELNGKRYFIWSGWEGYENVRQDLYLAEMISPTEVMDEKIMLSMPEYDFELNGNPLINEGPSVIIRGDTVNLAYSASGSWTDEYCLGLLTMDRSE